MSSTTVEVSEQELSQAIDAIVVLSRPIDFRGLAQDIYLVVQADVDERFNSSPAVRSGGVVYGGALWPALSSAYLARNPRREGGQILRDEGELLNSFQVGDAGNIAEAQSDRAIFGSALPKARGLQEDRPMLFVHEELANSVLNTIALKIAENA